MVTDDGVVHTYGEGNNWEQAPNLTGNTIQDLGNWLLWGAQMRDLIKQCGCQN
jgi:hypothetical protein